MRKRKHQARTEWQRLARAGLRASAAAYPDNLTIVAERGLDEQGLDCTVIRLPTGDLPTGANGLPVHFEEDVLLKVGPSPLVPPMAVLEHERFAGHSHVLQGDRVCVYLDPARAWNPNVGIAGFLEQLWQWFTDAVAGRFDSAVALYHPVGGVLHQTAGTPMVVIRDPFHDIAKPFTRAQLRQRTDRRLDLRWSAAAEQGTALAAVVVVPVALRYGAGTTLLGLLGAIAGIGHPRPEAVLRSFAATACRNPEGSPLYFVLAVPNKAGLHHHLIVGRLSGQVANVLRKVGTVRDIDLSSIPPEIPIEWCSVSDERPEITTRRDADRPVNAFAGKTIHLWGCGGLGSWLAEFIARAGPARMVVCDPAPVSGGLLVRQNYTENDLGMKKAEALAARLRALSDDLDVEAAPGLVSAGPGDGLLPDCDILIDATVSVALGVLLDAAARTSKGPRALIAQVATDVRSGSLGMMTVAGPDYRAGPGTIDHAVGGLVLGDGALERFHCLWQEPAPGDEIVPARGCSTPTFHGSAADLAALSGVLVSLLGPHVGTAGSGTHLVALPHAAGGPAHRFIPAPAA